MSGPASVSQISEVPTAFGGLRSVVSNDGGPATSAKPGKEISKDNGRGFSGYPTLKTHTRFFFVQSECFACFSPSEESENTEAFIFRVRGCRDLCRFPPDTNE